MKKFVSIVLAVFLLLSLTGCSGGTGTKTRVDIFFYDYSDTYIGTVRTELETLFKKESDKYTFQSYDGANSQTTQTQQIETAITQGSGLLLVNIVTTGSDEASQNIVDLAKERDIPVIFFNREISTTVIDSYDKCAFVGTDADEAGYMQGQLIAEYLQADDNLAKYDRNSDGKISYVMFRGELGNAEAFGRTKYSVLHANELLGSEILTPSKANQADETQPDDGVSKYYLYGNWSATIAKDLMDTALTTYSLDNGDIELIIANNDDQALGAIEALNEMGYNTGSGDKFIPVFGIDATEAARDAIDSGKMCGTVKQDAQAMAECMYHLAENIQSGAALMDNTTEYHVDEGSAKIRIPYGTYTG